MIQNTQDRIDKFDPVQVAMAALCEGGRPDLALLVRPNRLGWPSIPRELRSSRDHDVIVRAFYLAHRSTGHDCKLDPDCVDFRGNVLPGIVCVDCDREYEESLGSG